jgi:hypothetical protein
MTNGIVSLIINGQMMFKLITDHDGQAAGDVAARIRAMISHNEMPTAASLRSAAIEEGFGAEDTLIIVERGPWDGATDLIIHAPSEMECDWNEGESTRYRDTFDVPQFNPRWKFGTAPYVEVVELWVITSAAPLAPDPAAPALPQSEPLG